MLQDWSDLVAGMMIGSEPEAQAAAHDARAGVAMAAA
jgi:hypothetical protein